MSALARKLRLPEEGRVAVVNAPAGYLAALGVPAAGGGSDNDFVQLFVSSVDELRSLGPDAMRSVRHHGLMWITYPKGGKTRGATDLPATPWWQPP